MREERASVEGMITFISVPTRYRALRWIAYFIPVIIQEDPPPHTHTLYGGSVRSRGHDLCIRRAPNKQLVITIPTVFCLFIHFAGLL